MPEADAITGVDAQHAIVAPASAGVRLVTSTSDHYGFALTEII